MEPRKEEVLLEENRLAGWSGSMFMDGRVKDFLVYKGSNMIHWSSAKAWFLLFIVRPIYGLVSK